MTVCLDSWAVLEWLKGGEPAATRVDEALGERPLMSWINVGEVFYVITRAAGKDMATEVVADLQARASLEVPGADRVLEAAAIKASFPMAYADAFAVATALAHDATLLTGDPEILGGFRSWRTEDLRPVR
ncbi:MAG: type II toxin-antitoxin system VapC family toxin [Acidimicrobiales bacterium]